MVIIVYFLLISMVFRMYDRIGILISFYAKLLLEGVYGVKKEGGVVSGRMQKLAECRNLAAVREAVRRINIMADASGKVLAMGAYSVRARRLLDSLKSKAEDAKLFISENDSRLACGELDKETARAEAVNAKTLLHLYLFLEKAYCRACEEGDIGAMRKIRTSADMLRMFAKDLTLQHGPYPKDEEQLSAWLRASKFREAQTLRESILGELGDVPQKLGLCPPEGIRPL